MATETFIATKDNFLESNAPNDNNGAHSILSLCNLSNNIDRIILSFDVSDYTAGSANILSAKLYLYYYGYYGSNNPNGVNVQVYKMTRNDWNETQSSWNNYKTGSSWTTPGGDYVTSSPSGASKVLPASFGFVEFDITDIVKDAIDNVSSHVNPILKYETESGATRYQPFFYSREGTSGDTSLRPKLVIEYTTGSTSNFFQMF